MNAFYEHHKDNIKFGYRCFDRILLNGLIQPFQRPEFQNWVKSRCQKWGAPILEAPEGRRDNFVDPYFRHAKADEVVVILKVREPARVMIAIGKGDHWHLQLVQRESSNTTSTSMTSTGAGCSFGCVLIYPFQPESASIKSLAG